MHRMPPRQGHEEASPLRRRFFCGLGVLLASAIPSLPDVALAQTGAAPSAAASKPEHSPQKAPVAVPAETVLLLIRSTLISLNDALQTGNYTVLRDLGAPSFARETARRNSHKSLPVCLRAASTFRRSPY